MPYEPYHHRTADATRPPVRRRWRPKGTSA